MSFITENTFNLTGGGGLPKFTSKKFWGQISGRPPPPVKLNVVLVREKKLNFIKSVLDISNPEVLN
jgi:hypothetical protein